MMILRTLSDEIHALYVKRAYGMHLFFVFIKAGWIAVFSAVAGITQFLPAFDATKTLQQNIAAISTAQIVGIAACVLVCIGSVGMAFFEKDATEALEKARQAIEEARNLSEDYNRIDQLEKETDRVIQLYSAMRLMLTAVEQDENAAQNSEEDAHIVRLLEFGARSLKIAMNVQLSDQWTLCIYKAVQDVSSHQIILKCIACDRYDGCKVDQARSWPEGKGVAGVAYMNQREVIIPDMQQDGFASVFDLRDNASLYRQYDAERYRSIAAMPIKVNGLSKPWGVVVATNDRSGHFESDSGHGIKTAEVVRALARNVAIAVKFHTLQKAVKNTQNVQNS